MYSGNEATSNYPTQWALNPLAYQDVDASQVDWASLAQQWIQMKDAVPAAVGAVPPPPPPKQTKNVSPAESNEGGEAPMDMGNDPPVALGQNQWNNSSANWSDTWNQWNWSWPGGPGDVPEAVAAVPFNNYPVTTDIAGYTTAAPPTSFNPGYWTADAAAAKIDSKRTDSKSRSSSRSDRRRTDRTRNSSSGRSRRNDRIDRSAAPMLPRNQLAAGTLLHNPTIDAAKRRTLPAWIREGLEKMEAEKQLKQEREEEELRQLEIDSQKKKEDEESEMQRIRDQAAEGEQPMMPAKSKFDTDSESEAEDNTKQAPDLERKLSPTNMVTVTTHLPHHTHTPHITHNTHQTHIPHTKVEPPQLIAAPKTREEMLQEVMLTVRRTLTEILLEVTNDEIMAVCQEELSRHRANVPASRAVADKPRVLAALKGGLGLGIYDDSSASESEDESSSRENSPRDSALSDVQLQEVIRKRKADFEKTCREIEANIRRDEQRLAAQERQVEIDERERASLGARVKGSAHGEQSTDSSSQSQTPDVNTTPDDRGSDERDGDTPPPTKNNFKSSLAHANPENPRKIMESSQSAVKSESKSRKYSVSSQDDSKKEIMTTDKRIQEKERDKTSSRREVPVQADKRLYKIKERDESEEQSSASNSDDSDDSKDSETGSSSSDSSSSESESNSESEKKHKNKRVSADRASQNHKSEFSDNDKAKEVRRKIDKDDFNIDSIKNSKFDKLDKYDKSYKKNVQEYDSNPEDHRRSKRDMRSRSRSEGSNSIKNSKYNKVDERVMSDKKLKRSRSTSKSYEISKSEKKQSRHSRDREKSRGKESIKDFYRSDSEAREKRRKDKYKNQSRERDRLRERYRDRSRERDTERPRESHRDRSRERDRDRSPERYRDRSRDRERDRSRERERSRESYRSRHRSKDRYRSEDRDKERYRSREKDREREKRGKRSHSHHRSSYRY